MADLSAAAYMHAKHAGMLLALADESAAAIERASIGRRLDAVEIEHGRAQHPSSWPDDESIAADIDAIARGLANLRTIDQLSPGDFVRLPDGEWYEYVALVGSVLVCSRDGIKSEYPVSDGEPFQWQPGTGF